MSIETIFYTQIGMLFGYVATALVLYRLLVSQKDSVIQLLKERIVDKDAKIQELEKQSPDALITALSSRIDITFKELTRLREDGNKHQEEIESKERELLGLKDQLTGLSALISDSDLVCEKCGAPLVERTFYPIYGHVGGREIEVEGEYKAYECGRTTRDGELVSPCKR